MRVDERTLLQEFKRILPIEIMTIDVPESKHGADTNYRPYHDGDAALGRIFNIPFASFDVMRYYLRNRSCSSTHAGTQDNAHVLAPWASCVHAATLAIII